MVSTTKEQSDKFYIGAHLQSRGYEVLVEIYLYIHLRWSAAAGVYARLYFTMHFDK